MSRRTSMSFGFLFSCLAGLFALSMFYRVITALISDKLIKELFIDARSLGIIGAAFFYAMAFCQVLMGPMLDRVSPRKIIMIFSLFGAFGTVLFSLSETFPAALSGRILMGIGMAPMLVGAFKIFTLVLPQDKFARFAGLLVSVGAIGNILATSPFAYCNSIFGWRRTLFLTSGLTIVFALSAFHLLRRIEQAKTNYPSIVPSKKVTVSQAVNLILTSLLFWQIAAITFFRYGTQVALQGLWLGLYLIDIEGYSAVQAGNILLMVPMGLLIGSPFAGWLYDKTHYYNKALIVVGHALYCLSLVPLAMGFTIHNTLFYSIICFFIGFFGGGFGLLPYSQVKDSFPAKLSGTAIAWVNTSLLTGAAVLTHVLGKVIEFFPRSGDSYPAIAYQTAFRVCLLAMLLSLIFYVFPADRRTMEDTKTDA